MACPRNFSWVNPGKVAGHGFPYDQSNLEFLVCSEVNVKHLVTLTEWIPCTSEEMERLGLVSHHIPVRDFTAPSVEQVCFSVLIFLFVVHTFAFISSICSQIKEYRYSIHYCNYNLASSFVRSMSSLRLLRRRMKRRKQLLFTVCQEEVEQGRSWLATWSTVKG